MKAYNFKKYKHKNFKNWLATVSYEANLASQCSHFEVFFKTKLRSEKIIISCYFHFQKVDITIRFMLSQQSSDVY